MRMSSSPSAAGRTCRWAAHSSRLLPIEDASGKRKACGTLLNAGKYVLEACLHVSFSLVLLEEEKRRKRASDDEKRRGVSPSMKKQPKQQAILHQIRSLAKQPREQADYALEILERERGKQVVSEALAVLTSAPVSEGRPLLRQLYDYYDDAGVKCDAGGELRTALVGALLPIAELQDQVLAERAVSTYEFMSPNREECTSGLRTAGLVLLNTLDPVLASFHCTRLLVDRYTSRMSGEPAVSAARFLAGQVSHVPYQGHLLPLYSYLFQDRCHPEVEGECLRQLAKALESVARSILSHYTAGLSVGTGTPVPRHETKDEVVLLGLFDLLLTYSHESACLSFIGAFLGETQRYDIYQYVLTTIIANHSSSAWNLLLNIAHDEREPEKIQCLLSALTLVQHDPMIEQLLQELQQKIAPEKRGLKEKSG